MLRKAADPPEGTRDEEEAMSESGHFPPELAVFTRAALVH